MVARGMLVHDVPLQPTAVIFYTFFSISFSDHKKLRSLPCSTAGPMEAGLLQMESMLPILNWTSKFLFFSLSFFIPRFLFFCTLVGRCRL
jgi:hypothetical protein